MKHLKKIIKRLEAIEERLGMTEDESVTDIQAKRRERFLSIPVPVSCNHNGKWRAYMPYHYECLDCGLKGLRMEGSCGPNCECKGWR